MAYTVLARRYRSQTFDEVVGQDHVAQTLKKAIASGRIAHAFLFTGTRGTGKTSMARILAKSLNCQAGDGPTPTPCLKCSSCLGIARGEDIDVVEVDAASNTQVDKTREVILDNAAYRPARSRFKVFIIDEVHMLSKASFNALLKTMEEPPEHVKFILATTEAEKVLPTILSRCQRYDFRNIPSREIAAHLKMICKEEGIAASDEALLLVAKAGAGSMRDSLSLLDRLLSIGEKKLTAATIEQLLGLPRAQAIFDLAQAIGEGRVKDVLLQADKLITEGLSADVLISGLTDHLRNLLVVRTCGIESGLVEVAGIADEDLAKQASRFDAVTLSQDITILEELRRQARQSGSGRALLDATLVRLALAEQFTGIGELMGAVGTTAAGATAGAAAPAAPAPPPAQKKKPETPDVATVGSASAVAPAFASAPASAEADPTPDPTPFPPTPAPTPSALPPAPTVNLDLLGDDEDDDLPRPGKVFEGPSLKELLSGGSSFKPAAPPPASVPPPDPEPPNVAAPDGDNLPALWKQLLDLLSGDKPGLHALLAKARLVGMDDNQAVVRYGREDATFYNMVTRNGKKEQVTEALGRVFGRDVGVRFEVDPAAPPAAAGGGHRPAPQPSQPSQPSPPPAGRPAAPRPGPRQGTRDDDAPAAPAPQQAATSARVTPEQAAEFEKDPLVSALLKTFEATMITVKNEE